MRAATFMCTYLYALLQFAASSVDVDHSLLNSVVHLVEMDYEDNCASRAAATWEELLGSPKGFMRKLERDKGFVMFAKHSRDDVKDAYTKDSLPSTDEILRRKVQLLLHPGDVLLDTDQWMRLVTFADTAQNKLRFATNYDCGATANCTLREFHNSYARQQDEATLLRMKESWEHNLPDINEYLEQILPLLRNASKDYKTVEDYWDSLVEYEGAILKARELWDNIRPLYTKLHKYIALRLKGTEEVGNALPVQLLRSLNGDDWSNVIESILPKHPTIYQNVHANLQLKNLGGMHAFKAAAELIKELKLGEIKPEVWSESLFNGTCPSTLVDWCKPNKVRVVTCKDVSIGNYLDAHETAMKILYKQITASYSNNTYILREAPRYSAIYEAIPGFFSLLALSPHALDRNDLFSLTTFNYNSNHHHMVLQLILALRDLPKLNYYLAADEWRLKLLTGKIPASDAAASWKELRNEFSVLGTSEVDVLADPYVVFNKPFIGKFMGLILKYQIYQSFAEELESDESDLVQHVATNSYRLSDIMLQGYSVKWPELVSDLLAKKENGLEYTGLTDYYRLLDEYLDLQFDPMYNSLDVIDDYLDPLQMDSEYDDFDLGEDPVVEDVPLDKPQDNTIDENSSIEYGAETTTVAAMEVKPYNDGKKPLDDTKEASYNVYWWIGLTVALAVVAVLVAIIARKRHNHKKQLEKQRRENSRA